MALQKPCIQCPRKDRCTKSWECSEWAGWFHFSWEKIRKNFLMGAKINLAAPKIREKG